MVHPPGSVDTTGEWKGIYNDRTGEMFVYHYDTQKGVGKKYNYSKGFIRSTDKVKIRHHAGRIPGYDNYKTFFEACDNFNRGLHDRSWPHKRGGFKAPGEQGEHHDFAIAVILQNTLNAYYHLNSVDSRTTSFQACCITLANEIYSHSLAFE